MSATRGWLTGDPASVAVWEHLPSGVRCHLVLEDADGQQVTPTAWLPMEEFLPGETGESLAHLVLQTPVAEVEVECGGHGDVAACRIWRVTSDQLTAHWQVEGTHDGWQVFDADGEVRVAPVGVAPPSDVSAFLRVQRESARLTAPQGGGRLAEPLQVAEAVLAANTIILPETHELLTLSRHTLDATGEWCLPNWQTFLIALGLAYTHPALAVANCRTALRHLASGSMLGEQSTPAGTRTDIAHPPVAAYCVWKIFQMTGDYSLLNEGYPILVRWHAWWRNFRDGNDNHLLEWASAEEAGMPGHPLYEAAAIDERTGVMRLDDVGLCSLWVLDAFSLMRMALQLNDLDQATHLETEMRAMADRMNLTLWNPAIGTYCSRTWEGAFADGQSVTALLALCGRIPTPDREGRLLSEHLTMEFATSFMLPTVGSEDPAYGDQQPWRGRVSPLVNYLVCEGLRLFGEDVWAERITLSGLELLHKSWSAHRQVFASYNAITGEGNDIPQDPLAPESALFCALGTGLLMDVEPWDGLRIGNLLGHDLSVRRFLLHGDRYDVASGTWGCSVTRNDRPWLEIDHPAILRNLFETERECSFQAVFDGSPLGVRIHGFAPDKHVTVRANGQAIPAQADAAGTVTVTIPVPPKPGVGGPGRGPV